MNCLGDTLFTLQQWCIEYLGTILVSKSRGTLLGK